MTEAERVVLERRRHGPPGVARASAALLLDRDVAEARQQLAAEEATLRGDLAKGLPLQPGRAGFSPCGIASLAACHTLVSRSADRNLEDLQVAFDPALAGVRWSGCGPRAVAAALALIAWLSGDEPLTARYLVGCRPEGILDGLLVRTMSLLVRDRGAEIGALLEHFGPEYEKAMARGLWRSDPDAFLHVRLLASLQVGAERGRVDLEALPDRIPYVPLWFLNEAAKVGDTLSFTSSSVTTS
jgi:hypothetical protein